MKLCNLTTSKALQELGYDGEYTMMYNTSNQLIEIDEIAKSYCIPAPRLDDAAYWIRDKYQLSIEIGVTMCRCRSAYIFDCSQEDVTEVFYEIYDDYDSALEAAVTKAIGIIKNNEQ